ncbi:deoxyribodipyrimidine photo-lyase [Vibrio sp. ZSDE26]|uniref:Deoxyribodipyrimidine photo-lyase n=1 Tax=Vibrio amylolyticus TaxID=2847292 RepID=A0A9X2BHQ6_9VIBR|nr:deoxyribodipyrimidine photo-lyase [Vibrio amylolyticus]MCK6264216.1 deoxyribodipyrimidine photo-lyase [Vibrio amylolyticus]
MSTLLWLRRDLRLHDNPALNEAIRSGASRAVYISTPKQWKRHHLSPIQADFITRHLNSLIKPLAKLGIELVHLKATDFNSQQEILEQYCQEHKIDTVFANSEPEANERKRDTEIASGKLTLKIFDCDTIVPVGRLLTQNDQMFKVFTPFKRAWLKYVHQFGIDVVGLADPNESPINKVLEQKSHVDDTSSLSNKFESAALENRPIENTVFEKITFDYPTSDSSHWPLSLTVLNEAWPEFIDDKLRAYGKLRDFPAVNGTSKLSPYLAIGALSPRLIASTLLQNEPELTINHELTSFSWLNELIWRDFYKHLIFHFPRLVKGASFQEKYQQLPWSHSPELFQAWCEGRTGYPLVDAAMRQLVQTGWMHNRLRMVVASFLTKHLLIDWKMGEQFFMSKLIDGDFSANNGGWQWAASTGCDAQPYFRIFNPITQSERFDPNGEFIRTYLPELKEVPNKHIHFPHQYLELKGKADLYCTPIVVHKDARQRALDFFKQSPLIVHK